MIALADRLKHLQTNVFADMDRAKARAKADGHGLIDLSLGSTDLQPPNEAITALAAASHDPSTYGYALFQSTRPFREACAAWYEQRYGIALDPETEVLPLIGSQEGTAHLPLAILNPGDVALLTDPGYPSHAGGVHLAGGQIETLPLRPEHQFLPVLSDLSPQQRQRAKMLVLSYPHNPTTGVADLAFWQETVAFCEANDIVLVHDFPYADGLLAGEAAPSVLQADRDKRISIEFFSFSKSFHMGGMRIGFAVGNAALIRALRQVKSVVDFNQYPGIVQAAMAALQTPTSFVAHTQAVYRDRRDQTVAALASIGWHVPIPAMAMYLWAPLPASYRGTSMAFCLELVEKTGVALAPGAGFGAMGEGYVRFALMREVDVLHEAVQAIAASGLIGTLEHVGKAIH